MRCLNKLLAPLAFLMLFSSGMTVAAAWEVKSFTDDFTDKSFYEINVRSNARDSSLGLQCSGGGLALFVNTKIYLNSGVIPIRLRIDKGGVYDGVWRASADGTMAIASQIVAERYIPRLTLANEIVVKVTDYRGVGYTSRFEISDEGKVFQKFLNLCGIDVLAMLEKLQIEEARRQAGAAEIKANKEYLASLSLEEKAVERFMDLIKYNAKSSSYPSRQCIASSLVTLGYLGAREGDYTDLEMDAALLNHLNSVLYICRTGVTDDITLEMRCDANDYEGLLKYSSSMAANVDGAASAACQR